MNVQQDPRAVVLPPELAPSLTDRLLRLLDEVPPTVAPDLELEVHVVHRCVVCHQAGKVGGHHAADGPIQWIHRSCHRRLHRSGRHDVGPLRLQRPTRTSC